MGIKNEATEIERKLQDLLSFHKNDPIKSNIRTALDAFKSASLEATTIKQALQASSLNRLLIELNTPKKHIYTLELMYLCLVHDLYTREDISAIISTLNGRQWDAAGKTKILQMCFYFVRFNLTLKICFQMLNIVIEQFAIEDPSVDLIGRPVICQVVEKILRKQLDTNSSQDEVEINGAQQLFDSLHDLIVNRGLTFTSYILLIITKFPGVEKIEEFRTFLTNSFVECCIKTLEVGKSDDKVPVFETILKVERSFPTIVSLEPLFDCFPNVYNLNPGCETMLRFLVCLFNIRTELARLPYPSSLFETLLRFIKNTDFSDKNSEKFVKFYIDVVNVMSTKGGTNEFIETIFDKIGVLAVNNQMVERLYFAALEYCSKNDLRGLFEKGLILGYAHKTNTSHGKRLPTSEDRNDEIKQRINYLDDHVFNIRQYMKSSWYIYFDTSPTCKISRLGEFSPNELAYFINAIPCGDAIASEVFDNAIQCFKMNMDVESLCPKVITAITLLEKLASKITDDKIYFDLILKFYTLNSNFPASPIPLSFVLTRVEQNSTVTERSGMILSLFEEITKNISRWMLSFYNDRTIENDERNQEIGAAKLQESTSSHLAAFISSFLASINPVKCWDEIFRLIEFIDCHFNSKLNIIIQIQTLFAKDFDKKYLSRLFLIIMDALINFVLLDAISEKDIKDGKTTIDALQIKTTEMFDAFAKHLSDFFRETQLWHRMLLFCSEMINQCSEIRSHWMDGVDTKIAESALKNLEILAFHFLELFFMFFNTKTQTSEFSFFEILFKILYEMKRGSITLKVLQHLSVLPVELLVKTRISDLVEFITRKICEEDEEIALYSFGVLKRIAEKAKDEIQVTITRECKGKPMADAHTRCKKFPIIKYRGKKRKDVPGMAVMKVMSSQSTIDFNEMNRSKIDTQDSIAQSSATELNTTESKVTHEKLSTVIIDAFEKILRECAPTKSSIIFQVFEEIPSFKLNIAGIFGFSEQLKKFVEMPDPFRTHAVDCFIKACSNSQHFSFCLQMLSSWLSENSKETSLSLISKISESLQGENQARQTGLCNFMEYSLQFCKSDDFLEPVLNLIARCDFPFHEAATEQLIRFSKEFINGQLTLPYTQSREKILVGYLDFIKRVVDQDGCTEACSKAFCDMIVEIIRYKTRYHRIKLKGYKVLFDLRKKFKEILVEEVRRFFVNSTKMFMTHGLGIPPYVITELYFVLEQMGYVKDRNLVEKLKTEISELLLIKDHIIIERVRVLLMILFSE